MLPRIPISSATFHLSYQIIPLVRGSRKKRGTTKNVKKKKKREKVQGALKIIIILKLPILEKLFYTETQIIDIFAENVKIIIIWRGVD